MSSPSSMKFRGFVLFLKRAVASNSVVNDQDKGCGQRVKPSLPWTYINSPADLSCNQNLSMLILRFFVKQNRCKLLTKLKFKQKVHRLVACFGLNIPLRQYFSLYRTFFQKKKEERKDRREKKIVKTTPTRTNYKCNRPLP